MATKHKDLREGSQSPRYQESITFSGVDFAYPESKLPVLSDINWTLAKGDCVAFVGESGGGKTTIIDLVTGLLTPSSGAVLLDGVSLEEIDLEAWQGRIGLVMQESPLFHVTVLQNIAWLDPNPDRERAMHCAELAHAASFIRGLPDRLDTLIGEKGARLSGGQRQRLALARALYRDPWLLVLDEATSALDGESEAVVQKALESIKGRCSMLVVAHRLKTVQMADRILVLENGRVVEEGTWNSLLAVDGGTFAAMAARQGLAPVNR